MASIRTLRERATLEPGPHGWELLGRALACLRPHLARGTLAALTGLLQAALAVVPALAFKRLLEELQRAHPAFGPMLLAVVVALAGVLLAALLGIAGTWWTVAIGQGLAADLRAELFSHLVGQTVGYHTRARAGDALSRILNDIGAVESTLESLVLTLVRNLGLGVAMVALMFALDWRLALVTLVVVPLVAVPTRLAGRATSRSRRAVQEQFADMTAYLQEVLGLSGVMLVRAFGRQPAERARFDELSSELRRRQLTAAMAARWFSVVITTLQAISPALLIVVGAYLVSQGLSSLSTVIVFATVIFAQFASALSGLATSSIAVAGSAPVWRRVFSVLDEPPDVVERPGAVELRSVEGRVSLRGVEFTYPGASRPALVDVSVEIEPGQFVALVGPSGAGKTTLSALVARFADPQKGQVLLDGHDLRDLTLASVGRAVGVVFQDPFLFHTTLRENLRFGRSDASDAELDAAAREAQLLDVVRALPEGWDTVVGERGHRLSGGEKQRVALARVLLRDPRVLVLDEATAHLDPIAEAAVQRAFAQAARGRTSLVIAHRLSTVRHADVILVLDAGRVVERGSHEQLLGAGGLYTRLYDGHLDRAAQSEAASSWSVVTTPSSRARSRGRRSS